MRHTPPLSPRTGTEKKSTAEQLEATKEFWKIHKRMVKTAWLVALKMERALKNGYLSKKG